MTERRGPPFAWITEHVKQYQEDPEKGHMWDSSIFGGRGIVPTLLLTTTGRKSGLPNITPVIYGTEGDRFIVNGSKGGSDLHTQWFLNLQENPECQIQVIRNRYLCRARVAEGEERQRLWDIMTGVYEMFVEYQAKTERQIPVVVLEVVCKL